MRRSPDSRGRLESESNQPTETLAGKRTAHFMCSVVPTAVEGASHRWRERDARSHVAADNDLPEMHAAFEMGKRLAGRVERKDLIDDWLQLGRRRGTR